MRNINEEPGIFAAVVVADTDRLENSDLGLRVQFGEAPGGPESAITAPTTTKSYLSRIS
jgi:hypothetical protein